MTSQVFISMRQDSDGVTNDGNDGQNGPSDESLGTGVSRRQFLGTTSAMGAAAGLSGCNLLGGGDSDALTLGVMAPSSGAWSAAGPQILDSVDLAVDRFDGSINGMEIETVSRDTESSSDAAVPAVEEMIASDGIDLLVGAFGSGTIMALQDVVTRNEIPYFTAGGTAPQVTGENCSRYTFASIPSAVQLGAGAVVADELDLIDSIFVIVSDYAGAETRFEKKLEIIQDQSDLDYQGVTYSPLGGDDFSPYISEARDSGADCVYVTSGTDDAINYIKQGISAGLHEDMEILAGTTTLSMGNAFTDNELDAILGGGGDFYWNMTGAEDFSEDFMDANDDEAPDYWAGDVFDSAMEALTAVQETGSTNADDIIDFAEGRSFSWSRENSQWRACDHRKIQDIFLFGTKDPADREHEQDYYTVEGSIGGEAIMQSCEDTGCEM